MREEDRNEKKTYNNKRKKLTNVTSPFYWWER